MADFDPRQVERPVPALLTYYLVISLVATLAILPLTAIILLPHYLKYRTMRYRFDDEGVSMSYGAIFRKETQLAYRRIQDIHVTHNIFQRWMGLATVAVQTASGSAAAEMSIEGIPQAEELRDFLYARMRGARHDDDDDGDDADDPGAEPQDEALALLHEIRDLIRAGAHDGNRDG